MRYVILEIIKRGVFLYFFVCVHMCIVQRTHSFFVFILRCFNILPLHTQISLPFHTLPVYILPLRTQHLLPFLPTLPLHTLPLINFRLRNYILNYIFLLHNPLDHRFPLHTSISYISVHVLPLHTLPLIHPPLHNILLLTFSTYLSAPLLYTPTI